MTDPPRHPARRSLPTLPDVQPSGAAAPSMRGPLPTSNWVVPGLLLCGAEPDGPAALRLVMLGVRVFVCLQSELPSDRPLPYRAHAERGSSSADDEPLEFVHEPIPDGTTFREEALRELVERVAAAVRVGRPVYVWLDFACIDQDDAALLVRGVNSLPLYVQCADVFISLSGHPVYYDRAWVMPPRMEAWNPVLPRHDLSGPRST